MTTVSSHIEFLKSKYKERSDEIIHDLKNMRSCEIVKKWELSRQVVHLYKKGLGLTGRELQVKETLHKLKNKQKELNKKKAEDYTNQQHKIFDIIYLYNSDVDVETIASKYEVQKESMYQLIMKIRALNPGLVKYRHNYSYKFDLEKYETKQYNTLKLTDETLIKKLTTMFPIKEMTA